MTPPEWRRLLRRRSVTDTATRPSQFHGCDKRWYLYRRGSSTPRDLSLHKGYPDLQAIAVQRCLYHGLTRLDSSLNSIFMLGGAPKAREVYSERSMRNTSGCNIK